MTRFFSGIWVDHSIAYIANIKDAQLEFIKIRSHVPSFHRSTAGSRKSLPYVYDGGGNDHKIKNKINNAAQSFYKKIEAQLLPQSQLFITGPSLAKKELAKFLKKHHWPEPKIETSPKLSQKQFIALVRKHFQ